MPRRADAHGEECRRLTDLIWRVGEATNFGYYDVGSHCRRSP